MIAKQIKKMKDNKSPGVDGTPPKLLKKIVEQISTPLAKWFNLKLTKSKVMSNQSLMFLEEITKWIDDRSPVDVVYLDFQKAFDKVPHQRVLLKLKAHGIGNGVINRIE